MVEKLVTQKLTLNRVALKMVSNISAMGVTKTEDIALKVIQSYKDKYDTQRDLGATKAEALEDTLNDKRLLVQRVQNEVVNEFVNEVKEEYDGERYEWLPSDAAVPDPDHVKKYGKIFKLGKGEMPGDRFGCRCGMKILVKENSL